ncbi:MAG: hypothetical protein ACFCU4_03460 [Puniceicoccaceae bacterium]
MRYLIRFILVFGACLLVGLMLGLAVIGLTGDVFFPNASSEGRLKIAIKGGLIFGGIWGLGIAIVSCFMLGHSRAGEKEI